MASTAEGHVAFEGSASEFQSLEEKVYRAIELLKEARAQKAATEMELAAVRELLEAQSSETDSVRRQLESLQQERASVRERVEKLLGEMDAILEE
jgi:FtsZ-binding cell division protein ZapB